MNMNSVKPPMETNIRKNVHTALKRWRKDKWKDSPLADLRLFQEAQRERQTDMRQVTGDILHKGLQVLATSYAQEADILRMRFLEGEVVHKIAGQLSIAEGTVYNKQSEAISHLADILWEMESEIRTAHRCTLDNRLGPPSYIELVGVESHLAQLSELICTPGAPWLVAIAGMGGIGKTSLADALVRTVFEYDIFDDVGWVTAQQQSFSLHRGIRPVNEPALTVDALVKALVAQLMPEAIYLDSASPDERMSALCERLKARPHLIVVDNLETLTDIESLVSTLRNLANPTKFILTSRESLFAEPDIYHFPVPQLSEELSLSLVRQEAEQRNLPHLAKAPDKELKPIVETVGGNPLAIRLVVGQMHVYALDVILENLWQARGRKVDDLYTYLYHQAWDNLDEIARRVLLVMPLVSNLGGTMTHVGKVSQVDMGDLSEALETLVQLNLVDSRGNLSERRYTIHNLTRTFLHEQVIKWQ